MCRDAGGRRLHSEWDLEWLAAANVETATRVLDRLGVGHGTTLLVEGAAGGVGSIAVQLAVSRGATVIGTASARNHDFISGLGATPTTYGSGLRRSAGNRRAGRCRSPRGAGPMHRTDRGRVPLTEAIAAHELSETGHARGKIVLTL